MVAMVVGGNGQLGSACCEALLAQQREVRVGVRDRARAAPLERQGAEVVLLDVTDAGQRRRALQDVDVLLLSANAVVARAGDDPAAFDRGLAALLDEALAAGVARVVLPSVSVGELDAQVPTVQAKRLLEERLSRGPGRAGSCGPAVHGGVVRARRLLPAVARGAERHARPAVPVPAAFPRADRVAGGGPRPDAGAGPTDATGTRSSRSSDAARACVAAAVHDGPAPTAPLEVTGPQVLTWRDVADLYAEVLDRRVRVLSTPAVVYGTAARLLAPIAQVASRTMALNRFIACTESASLAPGGGLLDPETMVTAEVFLRARRLWVQS